MTDKHLKLLLFIAIWVSYCYGKDMSLSENNHSTNITQQTHLEVTTASKIAQEDLITPIQKTTNVTKSNAQQTSPTSDLKKKHELSKDISSPVQQMTQDAYASFTEQLDTISKSKKRDLELLITDDFAKELLSKNESELFQLMQFPALQQALTLTRIKRNASKRTLREKEHDVISIDETQETDDYMTPHKPKKARKSKKWKKSKKSNKWTKSQKSQKTNKTQKSKSKKVSRPKRNSELIYPEGQNLNVTANTTAFIKSDTVLSAVDPAKNQDELKIGDAKKATANHTTSGALANLQRPKRELWFPAKVDDEQDLGQRLNSVYSMPAFMLRPRGFVYNSKKLAARNYRSRQSMLYSSKKEELRYDDDHGLTKAHMPDVDATYQEPKASNYSYYPLRPFNKPFGEYVEKKTPKSEMYAQDRTNIAKITESLQNKQLAWNVILNTPNGPVVLDFKPFKVMPVLIVNPRSFWIHRSRSHSLPRHPDPLTFPNVEDGNSLKLEDDNY